MGKKRFPHFNISLHKDLNEWDWMLVDGNNKQLAGRDGASSKQACIKDIKKFTEAVRIAATMKIEEDNS